MGSVVDLVDDGLQVRIRQADDGRPEASPPLRRGVQTADRAAVRERQALPGDQGRVRHRAIDPAALGPRHPRQRLHPGHGQPHARAERADRAGETQQTVGDGGGRFRTSDAGIRTKVAVIRANAARYPISAQCRIPGVPRSTYYWMTEHPETEHVDPIADDVRAIRRGGRERYGARKIKAALERKGVTAPGRRVGGIMRERGMRARTRASGSNRTRRGPGAGRVRHPRLPADGYSGVPHRTGRRVRRHEDRRAASCVRHQKIAVAQGQPLRQRRDRIDGQVAEEGACVPEPLHHDRAAEA